MVGREKKKKHYRKTNAAAAAAYLLCQKEIRQYRSGKPSKYLHRTIPTFSSTIFHCYRIVTELKAHEILSRRNWSTTKSSSAGLVRGGKVSLRIKQLPLPLPPFITDHSIRSRVLRPVMVRRIIKR